ncbi:inositol polyphosphate-5-phosphatase A isoform X2 [Parasteatoda tepidariorum]|uniref:inositol polyphosphate-5-phosphatase A isoform X2 n=1 Tax=Parasteatoda tepidariorum TaxID=114398 RepID=UPI00077FDFD4|nr:inositol polyphosphate-5-phosphatase A isoform X2 [Parasteatoda tepidariorum]
MEELVPFLLVSANVGSIFEDPENLLEIWLKEFLMVIKRLEPKFLALHCQEVGGKDYKDSSKNVQEFIRALMMSEELSSFGKMKVYLDEDFNCREKFTALGSLYFVHNSLKDVQIWDFRDHKYVPVVGKEIYNGNIEHIGTKEKVKFTAEIVPECKWSRKGFMRTRWRIGYTAFDLVNIHLFHDESNFVAMEECPSKYSKTRQSALGYALHRFSVDSLEKVPFFIFGDFNFRLDTKGIVQKLTKKTVPVYIKSAKNGEIEKILYKETGEGEKVVLTLERKVFDLNEQEETFSAKEKWLQEYDREPKVFEEQLFEFDISFPPSYPFTEDLCGKTYMKTRCPSWCDRIFLSRSALSLVHMSSHSTGYSPFFYQLIGEDVAMGDHKPVMLFCSLRCCTGTSHREMQSGREMILPRISVTFPASKMSPSSSRFIHVKRPGSPTRIFRETTV